MYREALPDPNDHSARLYAVMKAKSAAAPVRMSAGEKQHDAEDLGHLDEDLL